MESQENDSSDRRGFMRRLLSATALGGLAALLLGRETANRLEVEGNASKTTAGSWLANSDQRIKTDIQDLEDPLGVIGKLHPVQFRYKEEYRRKHPSIEDHPYYNFIAQEYREVFPDSVKDDGRGLLQVDTHNVTPFLVRAVQELAEQNRILREQHAGMSKRLEAVEHNMKLETERAVAS